MLHVLLCKMFDGFVAAVLVSAKHNASVMQEGHVLL